MESSKIDYTQFKFPKDKINKENNKNRSKTIKKRNKPIKKRSVKQNKLERDRDKNLIKSGKCEYCGKLCGKLDPHEVYGGSNRKRSIKYGFVKLLCRQCHSNENTIQKLRKQTQKEFEKNIQGKNSYKL